MNYSYLIVEQQGTKRRTVKSGSRRTSLMSRPGRYAASSSAQMATLPRQATGSAAAIQESQEGGSPPRPISWMAKMFCGLLMGLVMPPRLDASAMPAWETGT